ncbi:LysR family transcriptional regulator [Solicola gregarius]|uniref:LysR substrate-binding domain-containing protein n=1 Tax=Solicola gregarius TaxID=2908642 RepID=A0AA46TJ42_9ACTN|nr:LysR family transcriptional regulator [Solicola gregarius]UYM06050.1 LysR substrate-binding domain-containing protein [Solicola gregarius]
MVTLVQLRILDAVRRHGSVTAAAGELHYTQPSVSHHLARLQSAAGAQLFQRVGRGIRLTEAGQVLATRAAEILGRVDAATAEVATLVGLRAGSVRLAGFASALTTLVPRAAELLGQEHPGLELGLTDTHPEEALQLLRAGQVDVAVIFRYDDTPAEDGLRVDHLLDDPVYLVTPADGAPAALESHRDARWIAGCERCRRHLVEVCGRAGFTPRLVSTTDDMVVMQSLVAAGMGVTTIPGLAMRTYRDPDCGTTRLPEVRRVYAATYGEPPDPPATTALLDALGRAAEAIRDDGPAAGDST